MTLSQKFQKSDFLGHWGKNCRFSNTCQKFSFLAKHYFLKDFFTTTLYLLDFIGF
jgi:hypothetical protein